MFLVEKTGLVDRRCIAYYQKQRRSCFPMKDMGKESPDQQYVRRRQLLAATAHVRHAAAQGELEQAVSIRTQVPPSGG